MYAHYALHDKGTLNSTKNFLIKYVLDAYVLLEKRCANLALLILDNIEVCGSSIASHALSPEQAKVFT